MISDTLEWSKIKSLQLKTPIFIFDTRRNEEVMFCEFISAGINDYKCSIVIANSIIYNKNNSHFCITECDSTIIMTNNVIVKLMDNQQAIAHAKIMAAIKESTKKMAIEQKAAAWDKASELAAAATKTDRATYEEVRQACIDAIKWQYEQDNPILIKNDK